MSFIEKLRYRWELANGISKYGATTYQKAKLWFFVFIIYVLKRTPLKDAEWKFLIHANDAYFPIWMRDICDITTFYEVFHEGQYDIDCGSDAPIIFDLGSNIGISVAYFRTRFPSSTVYGFEPDPVIFKKLEKNCLQFGHVHLMNAAIAAADGTAQFFVQTEASFGSSLLKREDSDKVIDTKTRSVDSLCKEFGIEHIDLLKFDIEGAEYEALESCEMMAHTTAMVGEVHLDLMDVSKEKFMGIFEPYFDAREEAINDDRFICFLDKKNGQKQS
jgi:FkbM family methyltransferase